jgi:hypothetical protein
MLRAGRASGQEMLLSSRWCRNPVVCAAIALCLLAVIIPRAGRGDGLRISEDFAALEYATEQGSHATLLIEETTVRVARGRAALSLEIPVVGVYGGQVALADEQYAVVGFSSRQPRWGLGDMAVGLDYNIIQNRERMFIVTLSSQLRFPTSPTVLGLGNGEYLLAFGLSAVYGITHQLLAFADVREGWVGILTPIGQHLQTAELGGIYWLTDRFGISSSLVGADYAGRVPASLQLNAGLSFEMLPGVMTSLGGIGGLVGSAPQVGGAVGFSFEI